MIIVRNLTKTYPGNTQALRGVTLDIGSLGMFGLVGPNGAGKTSLMRILAGLAQPTDGSAHLFGYDVTTTPGKIAIKSRLGYLPQELGLYPNLTAGEFLDYMARLKGIVDKGVRRRQIAEALEQVRLTEVAKQRLKTFSGGMKRRVGIAQALLGQPKLIIVDEPTVGLDPEERIRLRNLLAELAGRCAVILSTHIIEDIGQSCAAMAVISQGQVLFQGAPGELIAQAQDKVWLVETNGELPGDDVAIVSSLKRPDTTEYRILGRPAISYKATPAQPSLEDGYVWLMRQLSQK